jgi:hypothetical protein
MSDTPHVQVHQCQLAVLHELNELHTVCQGIMQMAVDICLPSFPFPPCFTKQDICSVINMNRNTKAVIYFHPKYAMDKKDRDELFADLLCATLAGGDHILSVGSISDQVTCVLVRSSIYDK